MKHVGITLAFFKEVQGSKFKEASSGTLLVLCDGNEIYCMLILYGSLLCTFKAKYFIVTHTHTQKDSDNR